MLPGWNAGERGGGGGALVLCFMHLVGGRGCNNGSMAMYCQSGMRVSSRGEHCFGPRG